MSEFRIMTVCTGNICRSPMGQIVLRQRFDQAGLADRVEVDSTGISAEEQGNPIDRRARRVLTEHGYRVGAHRARKISRTELAEQDLVLAMTFGHYRSLLHLGGNQGDPIRMYRSFDPRFSGVPAGPDLDIDDPWYGDSRDFERTLAEIEAGADSIVSWVAGELTDQDVRA